MCKGQVEGRKGVGDTELRSQRSTPVSTCLACSKICEAQLTKKTKLGRGVRWDETISRVRHSPATTTWDWYDIARADDAHEGMNLALRLSRSELDCAGVRGEDSVFVEKAKVFAVAEIGELGNSASCKGMAEKEAFAAELSVEGSMP